MKRLNNKIAIVTGAAQGTGAETARLFMEEGAKVLITDINDEQGEAVATSLGEKALFQHLDVRNENDWKMAVNVVRDRFGPVNVLVNNAAILDVSPISSFDIKTARDIVDVNLIGPLLGIRTVIPDMETQGGGSIINVGSIDSLEGMAWVAAYSASKWGLRGLTKCAALELGRKMIRVNLVCPVFGLRGMAEPFYRQVEDQVKAGKVLFTSGIDHRPMGKVSGTPLDAARMILFLASDESSFCNGGDFAVDGGHTAGHIILSMD